MTSRTKSEGVYFFNFMLSNKLEKEDKTYYVTRNYLEFGLKSIETFKVHYDSQHVGNTKLSNP